MKKNIFILLAIALTSFTFTSCGDPEPTPTATLTIQQPQGATTEIEVNGKPFTTITTYDETTKLIPVGANVKVTATPLDIVKITVNGKEQANPYSFTMLENGTKLIVLPN